jgi:glycosyltransferase involved in cell wall biosynthesis
MRIAVVGPTYPYRGGIAHYTTLLVRQLRATGHHVPFYSFTRQYPRWLFPGKTDRDPSGIPLQVECSYLLDPINPITWWRLFRRARADHVDMLVLQWWVPYWTPSLTMIARWIKAQTNIKIIFICHNVMPHEGGGVIDRRLALTVLRRGDALIVHSEQDRHRLLALLPNSRVVKANLPTYADLVSPSSQPAEALRAELGIPPTRRVLLFFGFVRPYKGLEYLVQAMRAVREQVDAQLLVVGEFWTAPDYYRRYAEEFGVSEAVTMVNRYVPNEELRPYFELAEVVVLPYVAATQSAVVQLAFGFGKPVITTRVGGLHEVVKDGLNGLIVPPQDEQALAAAIIRYFTQNLAEPLSAHVQRTATAHAYSWQQLVATIEQTAHELGVSP